MEAQPRNMGQELLKLSLIVTLEKAHPDSTAVLGRKLLPA